MLPAYIIHHRKQEDRKDLVQALVNLTGATIVEPVWMPEDAVRGCRESHKKVARLAKEKYPEKAYLLFEDDCEILDSTFLDLLKEHPDVDILYFGVTHYVNHTLPIPIHQSCGTHAMMITPKARDIFLSKVDDYLTLPFPHGNHPVDQIYCVMEVKESFNVWKPDSKSVEKYVRQKPGLVSTITKKIRKEKDLLLYLGAHAKSSWWEAIASQNPTHQLQENASGQLEAIPLKPAGAPLVPKVLSGWQWHELRRSSDTKLKAKPFSKG
jgi:hypothetical protein